MDELGQCLVVIALAAAKFQIGAGQGAQSLQRIVGAACALLLPVLCGLQAALGQRQQGLLGLQTRLGDLCLGVALQQGLLLIKRSLP